VGKRDYDRAIRINCVLLRLSSFIADAIVASRTDGIATIPASVANFFAKRLDAATFGWLLPLSPIEIAQYWHERYHRDPGHYWLRAASSIAET
jgi:DNA-binding transcriptional LysR family regulator